MQTINLLLFSAQHVCFGVYAEQVMELLKVELQSLTEQTNCEGTIPYKDQKIQVIDISKRLELHKALINSRPSAVTLNSEEVSASEQNEKIDSPPEPSPRVLVINHPKEGCVGVRIGQLRKLLPVAIEHIHTLPVIMQKNRQIPAVWGIALVENRPVILIDLEQL